MAVAAPLLSALRLSVQLMHGNAQHWSLQMRLCLSSMHPRAYVCMQVAAARAALPEQVRVVCLPQDDAWFRDSGPTVGCWLVLVAGCCHCTCLNQVNAKGCACKRASP